MSICGPLCMLKGHPCMYSKTYPDDGQLSLHEHFAHNKSFSMTFELRLKVLYSWRNACLRAQVTFYASGANRTPIMVNFLSMSICPITKATRRRSK